jgi:hypothetical protein
MAKSYQTHLQTVLGVQELRVALAQVLSRKPSETQSLAVRSQHCLAKDWAPVLAAQLAASEEGCSEATLVSVCPWWALQRAPNST